MINSLVNKKHSWLKKPESTPEINPERQYVKKKGLLNSPDKFRKSLVLQN